MGEESVQREWNRFGMPDFSDRDADLNPLALTSRSTTNSSLEMSLYDSSPAPQWRTALGDALAKAQSTDFTEEDFDASGETRVSL
jgi:hypothetical protein